MVPVVSVAIFVFLLYCVLDVALSDANEVRNFPKIVWLVFVVLVPVIGGIAWLVAGRPEGRRGPGGTATRRPIPPRGVTPPRGTGGPRATPGRAGPPRRRPSPEGRDRPKGPDDDPEFLRQLGERLQRRDDEE